MSRTIVLPKISFGFTWLILIPAGIWAIAGYYLPLFSENLTQLQTWIVTLLIALMIGVSLVLSYPGTSLDSQGDESRNSNEANASDFWRCVSILAGSGFVPGRKS